MKNIFLLVLIASFSFSCNTESQVQLPPNTYQVDLDAKGIVNGIRAHLKVLDNRNREIITDTAIVMNESATFKGKITGPAIRILTINGVENQLPIVVEPGVVTVEINKDSLNTSKVSGSDNNDDLKEYNGTLGKISAEIAAYKRKANRARQQDSMALYNELDQKVRALKNQYESYPNEFVKANPDSDLSLLILERSLNDRNVDVEALKSDLALLSDVVNRNPSNKLIDQKIRTFIAQKEAVKNVDIGRIAPNFSSPTPDGKELELKDVLGKATIIDFWASWCGPCRRENPNVVKVYEKYHDKGLEIISVSLDKPNQKQRWLDAIEKDNMNWHHVSNLKYWNDPVAQLYSVKSIPATFILDENGRIVAKKLRGDALERQIAQMLD